MKMRTILTSVAMLAIFASSVSYAEARGMQGNRVYNQNVSVQLSDANAQALQDMRDVHFKKMSPIHEQMRASQLELNALSNNGNADSARIRELAKHISQLQTSLDNERIAFAAEVEEKLGINIGAGRGQGRGYGRGYHMGRGNGYGNGQGRGYGNGYGNGQGGGLGQRAFTDCPYL